MREERNKGKKKKKGLILTFESDTDTHTHTHTHTQIAANQNQTALVSGRVPSGGRQRGADCDCVVVWNKLDLDLKCIHAFDVLK